MSVPPHSFGLSLAFGGKVLSRLIVFSALVAGLIMGVSSTCCLSCVMIGVSSGTVSLGIDWMILCVISASSAELINFFVFSSINTVIWCSLLAVGGVVVSGFCYGYGLSVSTVARELILVCSLEMKLGVLQLHI